MILRWNSKTSNKNVKNKKKKIIQNVNTNQNKDTFFALGTCEYKCKSG